ncbi:TT1751-like protein [Pilatotrama ljubarskyi]|nr:TT1751-like protein [Pilatotrama ljubarskyi]
MTKSVVEYTGRRVTYQTSLPFAEVAARLEKELNKPKGGAALFHVLGTAKSKAELERGIAELTGGRDFIYFGEIAHHRWLGTYTGSSDTRRTAVYTFGNPLIAQTMLQRDLAAGLHIPPKLLLLENADGSGTSVIYDDPSSIIPVFQHGQDIDEELKKAAEGLSVKVEALVEAIVREAS